MAGVRRSVSCWVASGLAMVAMLAPLLAQAEPRLRAAPQVSGAQITLGDLFDDAGAAAGVVVGRAPGPGQRVIFSAPVLQNRAARAGLQWDNREGVREVIVAGTALSPPRIAATRAPAAPAAPASPAALSSEREVAVLSRAIARGDVIGIDDVSFAPATAATPADALDSLDQLVGMSARRALAPDRPLRASDVMVTPAVKRGEQVSLVFQSGSMRISMRARALQDGVPGDVVRVLNTDSNRTVEALVEAPGVARVLIPSTSATITAGPVSARSGGL